MELSSRDLFEIVWRPIEPRSETRKPGRARVLILAGDEHLAAGLRDLVVEGGGRARLATWREHELDDEGTIDQLLAMGRVDEVWLVIGQALLRGRSLADGQLDELLRRGPGSLAACARSLAGMAGQGQATPRLRVFGWGACAAGGPVDLAGAMQAPAFGLARAIAAEHPQLDLRTIDLDPRADLDTAVTMVGGLVEPGLDEPELALRGGRCLVPRLGRLVPRGDSAGASTRLRIDPDAAYLIATDPSTSGLGCELARVLAARGARRLVLAGPRVLAEADEPCVELLAELEARGVALELARIDLRDRATLDALRRERRARGAPPIRGVVHAATSADASVLATLDPCEVGEGMALELAGSWNLVQAFGPLERLILCTRASSLVPELTQGHGCRAAGHAFQHVLAHALRARGIPATAIALGPWLDRDHRRFGLARFDRGGARARRSGLAPGDPGPEQIARALDWASTPVAELVCAPLESGVALRAPLLAELVEPSAPVEGGAARIAEQSRRLL